eukprot:m.50903 g.50903  ORF g.50903 m.50903 type:complete len:76 (-) comp7540_c1_seq3:1565-1792(-)
MSTEMKVTKEELQRNHIPLAWRDSCAYILIPLNKCRESTRYMPWKCEHERHLYEKCQYELYLKRMKNASDKALSH